MPEAADRAGSAAGGSEMSAQGHGDAAIVGLVRSNGESHVEIVERASESKEQVEPDVEHGDRDKTERRFGERDSPAATIEPEEVQSPRDRAAAKRLVATDPSPIKIESAALGSGETAKATASAIVSLANQTDPAVGDASLNLVVDELAINIALDTSFDRLPETVTADGREIAMQPPTGGADTNAAAEVVAEHTNVQTSGEPLPREL